MRKVALILGILMVLVPASSLFAAVDGAALYKTKCASCHGADGKGSPVGVKMGAKDFHAPEVAKMSDAELTKIIEDGKAKMPAFKGKLTAEELGAIVKTIRSLK